MTAHNNLELVSGHGVVHLTYWDNIHGNDVDFVISGGNAYKYKAAGLVPCDLPTELQELCERIEGER